MNITETSALLAMVAANDRRTIGETDIEIWHDALADLTFEDCRAAVRAHIRDGDGWLMPAHVRRAVKAIRAARLATAPDVPPNADPDDPHAYRQALLEQRRALADGQPAGMPRQLVGKPAGWARQVRAAIGSRPVVRDEPMPFRQAMAEMAATTANLAAPDQSGAEGSA